MDKTPLTKVDDLDAVRSIAETLTPFEPADRERIIRWVWEKLKMPSAGGAPHPASGGQSAPAFTPVAQRDESRGTNIKAFTEEKQPKSDGQFATLVAYYHRFVVPEKDRKESISKLDLVEACRLVKRSIPKAPNQTLVNAHADGLLDKAGEPGQYTINSVGENLVSMVLPSDGSTPKAARHRSARGATKKRAARGASRRAK